jgi:hypothetical protein
MTRSRKEGWNFQITLNSYMIRTYGSLILGPASCNSSGCMDGATNVKDCNDEVIPANGLVIKQLKVGNIPCAKLDKYGNHVNYTYHFY